MPWDQIFSVCRWVVVSDDTGWWRWTRMVLLLGLIAFLLWLWLLKDTVGQDQHAMRQSFGAIKFRYYDGYEHAPGLRPKWYKLYRRNELARWWRARLTVRCNRLAAKRLRNSPEGNKPHRLLHYGQPRFYGPGWRTVGPKEKGVKLIKLDTRNRFVDLTLYVRMERGFEVFVLPVRLTVRVANMYLWLQASTDAEAGILSVLREKSRAILQLGYETIRSDADKVKQAFLAALAADGGEGSVGWYGGEVLFINPAAPEYQPMSMVAEALRGLSVTLAEKLEETGVAVVAEFRKQPPPEHRRRWWQRRQA